MPPFPAWFDGRGAVMAFLTSRVLPANPRKVLSIGANGQPAAATYVGDSDGGGYRAHNIQVLTISGDRITRIDAFLETDIFALFELPLTYPATASG